MSSSRHYARQIAFQYLYAYEQKQIENPSHTLKNLEISFLAPSQQKEITQHFEHFEVDEENRLFAAQLAAGTLQNLTAIDATLESTANHWKINRMSAVDRNILRMGIYEILYYKDTPVNVVLDEAIELAKAYGTTESSSFINGILDKISKKKSA